MRIIFIMAGIRKKTLFLLMLAFFFFLPEYFAFSQSSPGSSSGRWGDSLTLKVALIGPGDELYFWWGHIGLVVEDAILGRTRFYDWGVFSFDTENFFVNFAFGNLIYSCAVSTADSYYNTYVRTNRDVILYTLDLPAEKKEMIVLFAENNVLPENRDYPYHHFRLNCATKIIDILDMALDGQFKSELGNTPGRFTLRQHVRRHTWFNPLMDWFLNFLMGQDIDRPITVWDEMFLPSEVARQIQGFRYTDPDGRERSLVNAAEVINRATGRPGVLDAPRELWPGALLASLLFCEIMLLLYILWGRRKGFRIFTGIVISLSGLLFGLAGSMLFFLSFLTNHDYTFNNINVLFVNPLLLIAVPFGITLAFSKSQNMRFTATRFLRALWAYVLLGGLLTVVIKIFPAFFQQNHVTQALVMPIALTIVFIMTCFSRFRAITK